MDLEGDLEWDLVSALECAKRIEHRDLELALDSERALALVSCRGLDLAVDSDLESDLVWDL